LANICIYMFFGLIAFVLLFCGETRYIIETGFSSLGRMIQNFVDLSTFTDPLRTSNFPQNWTIYYWAYWMVWCVAAPFFIGSISRGRTVRQTILGGYIFGVGSTLTSFIVLGNYSMGMQVTGKADFIAQYILLTVCAFIFVLLTSIIEKASTFQMSQDMTKILLIIIYWLLLLVDVVIFCVLLEKLVVLLGSIEFQRLDINNIMELNIIEKNPRTAVKYIGANYMQCVENNHTILEKRYEVFNTCVRFLVLNVLLSLSLSFVCVFIFMK